ncbi:transcriptional regulator [Oxalobacteraceae bacterium A2-2]
MTSYPPDISDHEREVAEYKASRELAIVGLRRSMAGLSRREDRAVGLLTLATLKKAYGDIGELASDAGVHGDALFQIIREIDIPELDTEPDYERWFQANCVKTERVA